MCQERSSGLDQDKEPEPPQIKEEEEEDLCSSQEGEQLALKQETEAFMLTPVDEEDDPGEDQTLPVLNSVVSEANRDLQPLSNNSGSPGDEEAKLNDADNPTVLESRCSPQTGKKSSRDTCGNKFTSQRHPRVHAIEKPYLLKCDPCGRDFKRKADLEEHKGVHTECQIRERALLEEIRAGIGQLRAALREQRTPVGPVPSPPSTPEPSPSRARTSPLARSFASASSVLISQQHPDVTLRHVGPKDYALIRERSHSQVGRYGCLLFRKIISEENYKAWCKTTNWDGSKGKQALPHNVKNFVVETLKKQFPKMVVKDLKDCIDKINEFLRTPRRSSQGVYLQF